MWLLSGLDKSSRSINNKQLYNKKSSLADAIDAIPFIPSNFPNISIGEKYQFTLPYDINVLIRFSRHCQCTCNCTNIIEQDCYLCNGYPDCICVNKEKKYMCYQCGNSTNSFNWRLVLKNVPKKATDILSSFDSETDCGFELMMDYTHFFDISDMVDCLDIDIDNQKVIIHYDNKSFSHLSDVVKEVWRIWSILRQYI